MLAKVNCLVDYLKNRFNAYFQNTKERMATNPDLNEQTTEATQFMNTFESISQKANDSIALANLSISEWIKPDVGSYGNDFVEITKAQIEEASKQEKPSLSVASQTLDLRTPIRPVDLNETAKKQLSEADVVVEEENDDEEKKNEQIGPTKIVLDEETANEKIVTEEESQKRLEMLAENAAEMEEKNKKIGDLIKTLKNERAEQRFRFNKDILSEQYLTISYQFKQLNQEIQSVGRCCDNRKV